MRVKHWNRLLTKAVQSPAWNILKTQLDKALNNLLTSWNKPGFQRWVGPSKLPYNLCGSGCVSVMEHRNQILCLIYDALLYASYCLFTWPVTDHRLQTHLPFLQLCCLLDAFHLHVFISKVLQLLWQMSWFLPFTQVNWSWILFTGKTEIRWWHRRWIYSDSPMHTPLRHTRIAQGLSLLSLVRPASGV